MTPRRFLIPLALLLAATTALADWIDDYEDGLKAAQKKDWGVVVQKMTAALSKKPKENPRERTYGTQFIPYHPYYYRGVAYFNLGEFEKALADLEKAEGVGRVQLGSAESISDRARAQLAPTPSTQPSVKPPVIPDPVVPAVDPTVRRRAEALIADAQKRSSDARAQQAETFAAAQYRDGNQRLLNARNLSASAETTADWQAALDDADRAIRLFDAAMATARAKIQENNDKPAIVTDTLLAQRRAEVRDALQSYFDGNFPTAATKLEKLTKKEDENAMLWAFLGAAYYYNYYLESNESSRRKATTAFQRARVLRPNLTLNESYFSARVRTFYKNLPRGG
jgi:tetratricopeptide (TPR) repeat protein